uniref:SWIM-type zinc finger 7 associated protein 1 n=1 Tax=Lepisosteus oculatus TaxID=7918 RepID=W5MN76_LEPOC
MAELLTWVFDRYSPRGRESSLSLSPPEGEARSLSCILLGGRGCGKTCLLFLTAVMAASELGRKVIFLSPTPIQTLPAPLMEARAGLDPASLKKIKFVYPRTAEELLRDVACLHEAAGAPPSLLIVDGLECYLRWGGEGEQAHQMAARLSALLCDTSTFLSRARAGAPGDPPAECQLIVSLDTHPERGAEASGSDSVLSVFERYFPVRCTLGRDASCAGTRACRIYFSGFQQTEGRDSGLGRHWELVYTPSGAMEFTPIPEKSQAIQTGQSSTKTTDKTQ